MVLKWVYITLSIFGCVTALDDRDLAAHASMTELSYEDACENAANAEWTFINNPTDKTLLAWEKAEAEYGECKKTEIKEKKSANITDGMSNDPFLEYKFRLIGKPGDALLDAAEWEELISYSGKAEMMRMVTKYLEKTRNLSRQDVERLLSLNTGVGDKRATWAAWHRELTPLLTNFSYNLDLVSKASKANYANDVSKYWEMLSEYSDGYEKIESMWGQISALHKKVRAFVQARLAKRYAIILENDTIPAYLLGSLGGYDWTPVATDVIPYANLTHGIRRNLWKKNLYGRSLFKSASTMSKSILNEVPQADFWRKSKFNESCPARLINFCKNGFMGVSTCYQASIGNFLSAHDMVARVVVNQMVVENDPILNIANRYSGLEEGVAELFSILSVSPGQLRALDLVDNGDEAEQLRITSLMITALNVLPRLAYYLSADLWRLNAIKTGISEAHELTASWWMYRSQYEGVTSNPSDVPTYLDDNYITSNKPYLPRFVGTILAFQLYEVLMDSTEVRYDQIATSQINSDLVKMIQQGGANDWTTLLSDTLELDDIVVEPLLSFFNPLEEFIDNNSPDDYPIPEDREEELDALAKAYSPEAKATATTTTATPISATATGTTPATTTGTTTIAPDQRRQDSNSSEIPSSENTMTKRPDKIDNPPLLSDTVDKPRMETSKAVWSVAAVLIATVAICIIAIFGRRRCRKTPKNRRYV